MLQEITAVQEKRRGYGQKGRGVQYPDTQKGCKARVNYIRTHSESVVQGREPKADQRSCSYLDPGVMSDCDVISVAH